MSSVKPDNDGCEVDAAEESACAFIVSGGDGAVLFEFSKEVFDEMAPFIYFLIIFALPGTV